MSLSRQSRSFPQKCSSSFLKMFEFFSVWRLSGRVFQRMVEAGKKDFSRFDDLHRLRMSCKGFRVCRAESSDENGGRHSDSYGKVSVISLWNRVKQATERHQQREVQFSWQSSVPFGVNQSARSTFRAKVAWVRSRARASDAEIE